MFTLGSGICGGANGTAMLIVGRAIQGVGGGGITVISNVILSDLVSQKERGYYVALILTVYCVGASIGPFLGGIIVESKSASWRYLNLPFGGVSLLCLYFFLRVKWNRTGSILSKLGLIDYTGIALLSASTVLVLIAKTWADVQYSWSAAQVLTPLIAGMLGLVGFCYFEHNYATLPVVPIRLFKNRTALIVNAITFTNAVVTYWTIFFLPLYFQAVRLSPPARAGVECLPLTLIAIPGAALSGIILSKWGLYRWLHISGFGLYLIGFGLLSTLNQSTSTAIWATFLAILAVGVCLAIRCFRSSKLPSCLKKTEQPPRRLRASSKLLAAFGDFPLPARYSTVLPTSTRAALRILWRGNNLPMAEHLQAGPKS